MTTTTAASTTASTTTAFLRARAEEFPGDPISLHPPRFPRRRCVSAVNRQPRAYNQPRGAGIPAIAPRNVPPMPPTRELSFPAHTNFPKGPSLCFLIRRRRDPTPSESRRSFNALTAAAYPLALPP